MRDRFPQIHKHVAARFSPAGAFGLHLTVGLVMLLACTWAFGMLADEVVSNGAITLVDQQVTAWFRQQWEGGWTPFMLVVTHWHQPAGVLLMAALLGWFMVRRQAREWLLALVLAVPGGMIVNVLLKYIFQRARPSFDDPLVTLATYSFPSGHASGAMLFYSVLAAYIVCHVRPWEIRVLAVAAATAMVALVALSRVYVGAHYLSDVLAGIAIGGAWATICITAVSTLRRRRAARATQETEEHGV